MPDENTGDTTQSTDSPQASSDLPSLDVHIYSHECASGTSTMRLKLNEPCAMPGARAWLLIQQESSYGDILHFHHSLKNLKNAEVPFESIEITLNSTIVGEELMHIDSRMPGVCEVTLLANGNKNLDANAARNPVRG